jgi:hypothetical protein
MNLAASFVFIMMIGRDSTIDNIGSTMHDMAIYVRWRHLCHMHELYGNAARRFFFTVTSRDRGYSRRAMTRHPPMELAELAALA